MAQQENKFRPEEAAEYVDLSASTLAKLRCKGGGPVYMKVGKLIFYAKGDLDAWLASCRRRSTSEHSQNAA